jgi:hypothetical protein
MIRFLLGLVFRGQLDEPALSPGCSHFESPTKPPWAD